MAEKIQTHRNEQLTGQQPPRRAITVDPNQVAGWLRQLNQWIEERPGSSEQSLEKLRNRLEDACWLARWKRDRGSLEMCPSELAGIVDDLSSIGQQNLEPEAFQVVEELIGALSVNETTG